MRRVAFPVLLAATLAILHNVQSDDSINICEGVANGMFLADINNCSQYYTCYNNVTYDPRSCPSGYKFSPSSQSCDPENDAVCLQQCGPNLTTFAFAKTCNKYVLCYEGEPLLRECLDNLQYNPDTDRCDFPENVDCLENMCPANNINDIIFFGSRTNCSKYYICYNGSPDEQLCASGLQYNPAKKGCDYPTNVNCTIQASARRVLSYAKRPPVRASITCPKEGSHFFPNEQDDSSYFFCVNGSGVKLTCTPGLVYDKKEESCREPSHVST